MQLWLKLALWKRVVIRSQKLKVCNILFTSDFILWKGKLSTARNPYFKKNIATKTIHNPCEHPAGNNSFETSFSMIKLKRPAFISMNESKV